MRTEGLDLRRAPVVRRGPVALDAGQRAVLDLPLDRSAAVIGAPGSGKTTTVVELVADRIRRGFATDEVLVIAPARTTATRLRDDLAVRIAVPTGGPLARTAASVAFELAGHAAILDGRPAPRLITGGEQDSDLAQLLVGHLEDGTGPAWPPQLGAEVRALRGFRTELRNLIARATDHGVGSRGLREQGARLGRPEWIAAAELFDEYAEVSGWLRPGQADSSELVRLAVDALARGQIGDRMARLRLLVVDDLHEATESTLALLRAFAGTGVTVVAFGDPDVAANSFRGAEPDALGRLASVLRLPRADTLYLGTSHRQDETLRALTASVTARIGTAAAGRQRVTHAAPRGSEAPPIVRIEAATSARQWAAVARMLRERHLVDGVAWGDMAVVVRSGAQVPEGARSLALAEVPTRTAVGGRALREDRAARALLTVVDVGTGRAELTPAAAVEMLLGPFGGLDRLGLRRLRLALRAEELAGGGTRPSDALLVEALAAPGRLETVDHRVARSAARLGKLLAAVRTLSEQRATIEELLWRVWDGSGLAVGWRDQALAGGVVAGEANRDLDGVVALFTAAKRFVERQPGRPASDFLVAVLDAEVPEDTLSPQPTDDAVLVTTPAGVVGLEVDTVAVAGVQDGVWPNLRIRGSLLGAQDFVDALRGIDTAIVDQRAGVLADELRMFALAVSRARTQVIVAAVASDDEAPSVLFSLLPPDVPVTDTTALPPLSLRTLTGRLRREVVAPRPGRGSRETAASASPSPEAASALARLARAGVPGAHPDDWHGLIAPSTTDPLYLDEEAVPVSPSAVSRFEESPLDWFVDRIAGSQPTVAMAIGTLVHWALETCQDTSVEGLATAIEGRWDELLFESGWLSEHHRAAARVLVTGVAEYLADFDRDRKRLIAAEKKFELRLGRARLVGSIDRVEVDPSGGVTIVDLKTGNPVTKPAEIADHPQLKAYQLAYTAGAVEELASAGIEHRNAGAKLLFVKKGKNGKSYREAEQAPLDDDELDAFRARIEQAAAEMAATGFSGLVEPTGYLSVMGDMPAVQRVRAVSSD